jgi:hypothetical protein
MSGMTSGPPLGTAHLSEREKLRAALDGYNATDIGVMLEALSPGAGANRRKAERIEVLLRLLLDPSFASRAVATLSPFGRRLLGVARRTGRTSIAALLLAGQDKEHDEQAVRRELTALVNRALLLIENRTPNAGKVTLDLGEPSAATAWVWVPQHLLDSLGNLDDALPALPTMKTEPAAVEAGNFAILRRDLYLALRFLKGTGLRLTRAGEPHRADLRKLQAALQPGQAPARRDSATQQLEGRVAFLLRLIGAAGLTADDGNSLRADEGAEAFLNQSEYESARLLFEAWLELEWNEFRRIPSLAIESWSFSSYGYRDGGDAPEGERIVEARRAIVELLASAPAGWLGIAELVDRLRQTDPEFLITRVPEQSQSYYSYYNYYGYDTYYGNRQAQEQSYYRGITRADTRNRDRRLRKDQDWSEVEGAFVAQVIGESLRWLGLVDVGYDAAGARGASETPVAVRLTELGRRTLGAAEAPVEQVTAGAALIVQPNFEVLVLDALGHLDLIARLDAFADAQSLDRAAVYRLTRASIVRGLAAGWTEGRIVELLEASATNLPQNVRHTIGDWVREYERIHLHRDATILEAPDAATLDGWLADDRVAPFLVRRLAPTVALVRAAEVNALSTRLEGQGTEVWSVNYALDPPQVLDLKVPATLLIAPEDDDPYLRYRLDRFADSQGRNERGWLSYQISPESLRRAKEQGQTIDDVLSFLGYKARTGLSPDDVLTLRGWSGYYAPFQWAQVRAVELPPTVSWGDLTRIKALRSLILRVLNASLALVAEEQWPQLEAALTARGITLVSGLGVQPQADRQSAAQKAAASLGVSTGRQLVEGRSAAAGAGGRRRSPVLQRLSGRQLADFVESAIDNERTLTIEYKKPSEDRATVRTVDPHQLEVRGGGYYLHAFCHTRQEERVFRLANVLGVAVSDE